MLGGGENVGMRKLLWRGLGVEKSLKYCNP